MKGKNVVVWIVQIILGALFLFAGSMKLVGAEQMVQEFRHWGYSDGFRLLIGTLEVIGGIALLIPKVSALLAAALGGHHDWGGLYPSR